MSLADKLKARKKSPPEPTGPVWKGPAGKGPQGGVTQGLLSRYLVCKERFRLLVVEGLKPADAFNHRLEFGNLWHVCEEALAAGWKGDGNLQVLTEYTQDLLRRYPLDQEQVRNWYGICRTMFPIYVRYWEKHPDVVGRTSLLQEQAFDVSYKLPSGRKVRLRGKWDAVDLIGAGPRCTCGADRTGPSAEAHTRGCPAGKPQTVTGSTGVYLQENKTKSDINQKALKTQLTFDLQTMLYLVALAHSEEIGSMPHRLAGVRYNVIRRPRQYQGKKETHEGFLSRLRGIIEESPSEFFWRAKVEVTPGDVTRFRRECLDPVLENLLDDWEWWDWCKSGGNDEYSGEERRRRFPDHTPRHYRLPFGVYNPLAEGGASELDEYLHSGSTAGLTRTTNLFPELQE